MASETIEPISAALVGTPVLPRAKVRESWLLWTSGIVYALLVAFTVEFHEPWADEAQGFLLGRDASLTQLWGRLLHYEGSPGLWQTLLHALIRMGLTFSDYRWISAILGLAAVYLLLRYSPLPPFVRILLPFTYFLCYQYAVVARSYSMVAPLLFALAAIYASIPRRPALSTILLCLLAGVSVHGFILSACLWITLAVRVTEGWNRLEKPEQRKLVIAGIAYWCVLIFFMLCAWPAKDVAFAEHRGLANLYLLPDITKINFAEAFTGNWITSIVLIALSLPLLWRGGGWLFFLLVTASLCLFGTIVYEQAWHFGILFLAWLFALWISACRTRVRAPAILAIIAAIGFQCYWTVSAVRYDFNHAYSGSRAAAHYFRAAGLPSGGLYAVGYPTTALQPYFAANIYSNFHAGSAAGYWDWSKGNTANDPDALIASPRREFVLVGYKNIFEQRYWSDFLTLLGYQRSQHFDGATFWRNRPFELEAFDLYHGGGRPHGVSSVTMGDPAQAIQLLGGFYAIEAGAWRWTAKTFSVLLIAPPGADRNGAELTLHLFLPEAHLQRLGPITLTAEVDGHALASQTYSVPDAAVYSAHIPAEPLRSGSVVVKFQLDKAATNLPKEARELGVITTAVSLDAAK